MKPYCWLRTTLDESVVSTNTKDHHRAMRIPGQTLERVDQSEEVG